MTELVAFKAWLATWSGLPEPLLHMVGGMALLLIAAALLRRPFWDWQPWAVVLAIELANEANDLSGVAPAEATLAACWADIWATMLWPTALLLLAPWLLRRAGVDPRPSRGDGGEQPLE